MEKDKINLIYIASNGRSGSTLLELMLNAHPKVWTVGELQVLPWELLTPKDSRGCGCGRNVTDCEIWGPIIDQNYEALEKGSIHRFRDSHGAGRVLRFNELLYVYSQIKNKKERNGKIVKYGKENYELLEKVLDQINKDQHRNISWIVDSSKDLYRLMWLQQSGRFNIFVLHLIKDPRAFIYSMTRQLNGHKKYTSTFRMIVRWIVENRLIKAVCSHHFEPESVMRIEYERLAERPDEMMRNVCNRVGLDYDVDMVENFRTLNHGVSGNQMRHESRGIVLDEKWKTGLAFLQKLMIKIFVLK